MPSYATATRTCFGSRGGCTSTLSSSISAAVLHASVCSCVAIGSGAGVSSAAIFHVYISSRRPMRHPLVVHGATIIERLVPLIYGAIVPGNRIRIYSLATHRCIPVKVRAIARDVAVDDVSIDVDVSVAIVDIDISIHVHERAVSTDPSAAIPTVVVDPSTVIVVVIVEPGSDCQTSAE